MPPLQHPRPASRLKPLALSMSLHLACVCAIALLAPRATKPATQTPEIIYDLQTDALPVETVFTPADNNAGPMPQPFQETAFAADTATAPASAPEPATPSPPVLLSELPGMIIGPNGEIIENNKPITALPPAHAPAPAPEAEAGMDTYFAIFTQTLKDAYTIPNALPPKRDYSVRIQYEVAADGTIGAVTIMKTSGSAIYDASVVAAFKAMRNIGPRPDGRGSVLVADFKI